MKLPTHIGLTIEHNEHVLIYEDVRTYLTNIGMDAEDYTPEDYAEIIRTKELWIIRWYPTTPVGFYTVVAATLERALELANKGSA